eukprot:524996_1
MSADNFAKRSIANLTKRKLLALYFSNHPDHLTQEIQKCFSSKFGPGTISKYEDKKSEKTNEEVKQDASDTYTYVPCSFIVPHGAYCDAGPITAWSYHHLYTNLYSYFNTHGKLPSTIIAIGTNHRHYGERVSVSNQIWCTPFGDIQPNMNIINALSQTCKIAVNNIAHAKEHSIENQLPFIQYVYSQFQDCNSFMLVPILISYCESIQEAKDYASNVVNCLKSLKMDVHKDVVIVGTTDFTHAGEGYGELPPKASNMDLLSYTKRQDKCVMDAVLTNEKSNDKWIEMILKAQKQCNNSMCGLWSFIITLLCSRYCGFSQIKLLKYAVSSEVMFRADVTGFGSFFLQ